MGNVIKVLVIYATTIFHPMSFSNHVDITVANLHPKLEFMKLVLTYLLVMFFLGSCTMQKRMHRPGWHVQWNSKTRTAKTVTEKLPRELISKDGNIEKSTEELSEVTFDLEREDLSSVELIENQSKLEVAPIEQTDFGNDGPPSERDRGHKSGLHCRLLPRAVPSPDLRRGGGIRRRRVEVHR